MSKSHANFQPPQAFNIIPDSADYFKPVTLDDSDIYGKRGDAVNDSAHMGGQLDLLSEINFNPVDGGDLQESNKYWDFPVQKQESEARPAVDYFGDLIPQVPTPSQKSSSAKPNPFITGYDLFD